MDTDKFPDEPSSLSGWVVAVTRTISAAGVDPKPLMIAAEIDPMALADPEARVPIRNMQTLWRLAIEATGDAAIGLRVPEFLSNASLYAINTLVEVAPSFQEGWDHLMKFFPVVSTGLKVELQSLGDNHYEVNMQTLVAKPTEAAADASVSCFINGMMMRMRNRLTIEEIHLVREEPDNPSEYERLLGGRVYFGQPRISVRFHFEGGALAPSPSANPQLEAALKSVLDDYLKRMEDNNLLTRVRREIMLIMTSEEPSLERLAERFNMSARTLQRKLVAKQSGYRELVDEVRREMAEQLVQKSDLSFTDIAFRLGFRDASNFSRVFKRWVGMSPSDFRQQQALT